MQIRLWFAWFLFCFNLASWKGKCDAPTIRNTLQVDDYPEFMQLFESIDSCRTDSQCLLICLEGFDSCKDAV